MANIEEILRTRADYSSFLIHLTKGSNGQSARQVLVQILEERRLRAKNPSCLFSQNLRSHERGWFRAVCFTEAPLHQIKAFIGPIEGRRFSLTSYGLVFTKDYVGRRGGNPAFYVNTHHSMELKNALLELFQQPRRRGFETCDHTPILPLVTIFGKTARGTPYDFYWEREWKVIGDLPFRWQNVVVGLCPEKRIGQFERRFRQIRFISPSWGLDRIIEHLRWDST